MRSRMIGRAMAGAVALFAIGALSNADVIEGPELTENIAGWPSSGMRMDARVDVALTSFVFNNQGQEDTIEFWDRTQGIMVDTVHVDAGSDPELVVEVEWPLTAGHTYDLFNLNGNNGRWVSYSQYPTQNDHLSVQGVVDINQTVHRTWWFTFRFLTTGDLGPTIEISGSCPGEITINGSNMTPSGLVAFVYAFGTGSFQIPGGPCAGTELGLNATATLAGTAVADANGEASFSGNVPLAGCGRVWVQAVDAGTCGTSNVEPI